LRRFAADFGVECACTRAEIAAIPRPSLILLDLTLSSEPAPEVLAWLRQEPIYQDVPVFVFGSKVVRHDISNAFRLGANSCFLLEFARGHIDAIAEGIATYASLLAAPACGVGLQ
jgi:CheY-like chemotaxis protein